MITRIILTCYNHDCCHCYCYCCYCHPHNNDSNNNALRMVFLRITITTNAKERFNYLDMCSDATRQISWDDSLTMRQDWLYHTNIFWGEHHYKRISHCDYKLQNNRIYQFAVSRQIWALVRWCMPCVPPGPTGPLLSFPNSTPWFAAHWNVLSAQAQKHKHGNKETQIDERRRQTTTNNKRQ